MQGFHDFLTTIDQMDPLGNKQENKQEEKGISCNYKDIIVICSKGKIGSLA